MVSLPVAGVVPWVEHLHAVENPPNLEHLKDHWHQWEQFQLFDSAREVCSTRRSAHLAGYGLQIGVSYADLGNPSCHLNDHLEGRDL